MDRAPKLNPGIVEEASDWFVEFSEDTIDAAGRERFDAWLRRSPEHVQAYLKIAMLWEETPLLGKTRVLASDALVARVLADGNIVPLAKSTQLTSAAPSAASVPVREGAAGARSPSTMRSGSRRRVFTIAASLLMVITAAMWIFVERGTYSTAIGEQRSVRLEDGSTVDLNSKSKIRVRFSAQRRDVELLEGQALFRVTKDASRPFIVATDNIHVRAVGTQFDVYRKSSGTVVTVVEGRVAVLTHTAATADRSDGSVAPLENHQIPKQPGLPPELASTLTRKNIATTSPSAASEPEEAPAALMARQGEILLAAGEQVTVEPKSVPAPHEADVSLATAWTQRKIALRAAPLSEVVEEFNRYNTRQLVIVDPDLKAIKISGVFSSTDPDSLLRFLRALPNISVADTGGEIQIARK